MFDISRRIEFDAAHRLMNHNSKCRTVHGHRYVMDVSFSGELDGIGLVLDFGTIKQKLLAWIDEFWDHNLILHKDDSMLGKFIQDVTGQNVFYLDHNPTAEYMSYYIYSVVCPMLFPESKCILVKLFETPNCVASYPSVGGLG